MQQCTSRLTIPSGTHEGLSFCTTCASFPKTFSWRTGSSVPRGLGTGHLRKLGCQTTRCPPSHLVTSASKVPSVTGAYLTLVEDSQCGAPITYLYHRYHGSFIFLSIYYSPWIQLMKTVPSHFTANWAGVNGTGVSWNDCIKLHVPPASGDTKQPGKLWSVLQCPLPPGLSDGRRGLGASGHQPFHSSSAANLMLCSLVCFPYSHTATLEGGSGKHLSSGFTPLS